jgi:glutamate synthase domain-containing protein 2/glutamate synthase domain-containing protein 1/glutamate synthase domain-containing protein 3
VFLHKKPEHSACGVGFVASRTNTPSHALLQQALRALRCVEHRGACAADNVSADGVGIMTDIPFELFGYERGSIAVATLFLPTAQDRLRLALKIFEETFAFMGMEVLEYRDVPVDLSVLGPEARRTLPTIKHVIIKRPVYCRTNESFNKLLYAAKQSTRTKERMRGIVNEFFFTSLSTTTIVYKGLVKSDVLDIFYRDLQNPVFKTRFALFHRRFSTNTRTAWDKAQPFRLIGHNGEINTIAGNRSWSYAREQELGVPVDELLTHEGISDSGSLNEMVEALKYRSSIPRVDDALAIMMPPADQHNSFYRFWSRAMEPWDGPAFITYSDGETIGARLDRNGFRPCRWAMTDDRFYLCSEAGSFSLDESTITAKGSLHAGTGVTVELESGEVHFEDPSHSRENRDVRFDPRLEKIEIVPRPGESSSLGRKHIFRYTEEDLEKLLVPMIVTGKEPIGSMGDTARPAILSNEARSFFDYFYQDFAQVTNPPLDYLRESMVTDLVTHIGARPNIFAPKELIPPAPAIELSSPVLSLGQMTYLRQLPEKLTPQARLVRAELAMTFTRDHGAVGFKTALHKLGAAAVKAVEAGVSVLILNDRCADQDSAPIPSLLALRSIVQALTREGLCLNASIVVDSGEVRRTHDVAALISFGATAVCPYLALEIARSEQLPDLLALDPDVKERNLLRAFEQGVLKVMSKMGISVVRSYQGSQLFTAIGLGSDLVKEYFPRLSSPIGGVGLQYIAEEIVSRIESTEPDKLLKTYQFKEHNRGGVGEKHSMTNSRSRLIHRIAKDAGMRVSDPELYREYLKLGEETEPTNIRHLLSIKDEGSPIPLEEVQPASDILRTFGAGAMSFGAISAEAQRDIIEAMARIGGRSNSGEGGENPYYFTHGAAASIKQVASGRFGVTAEYLVTAKEFQIKIAQGAKPGEGGQLMGVKVTTDIARARHSNPGVDLISPPPLHDIYSIEDLKQLIYELKQFNPSALVNVKLVAGANIGTIALGVAKAGADVIHISGHDGGTGAAPLSSMKHAGLPWELGLVEVHQALLENGLRSSVTLRTDGGLHTGRDIVMAALLGAEEFEFGKLLLIAEGCVMARICEKNTCPAGIATHDAKFKAKYKGTSDAIVTVLTAIAEDVRERLSRMGFRSLQQVVGRVDLLHTNEQHARLIEERQLDLGTLLDGAVMSRSPRQPIFAEEINPINRELVSAYQAAKESGGKVSAAYAITTYDRGVLATVSAEIARDLHIARMSSIARGGLDDPHAFDPGPQATLSVSFTGSAGQGFGVFMTKGLDVELRGEANDSVCKAMSGGRMVIRPQQDSTFDPTQNTIIGNCALYGATGGTVFVHGLAGDRFAVRNSGACAVIEGVGLHACEYMTNGVVVILGAVSYNVGAGMTGGVVFLPHVAARFVNTEYVRSSELNADDEEMLRTLLNGYMQATGSTSARRFLEQPRLGEMLCKYLPVGGVSAVSAKAGARAA